MDTLSWLSKRRSNHLDAVGWNDSPNIGRVARDDPAARKQGTSTNRAIGYGHGSPGEQCSDFFGNFEIEIDDLDVSAFNPGDEKLRQARLSAGSATPNLRDRWRGDENWCSTESQRPGQGPDVRGTSLNGDEGASVEGNRPKRRIYWRANWSAHA